MDRRIQCVFREVYANKRLTVDEGTNAADVPGWDSLGHVKLMLGLEHEFGVKFSIAETTRISSVADIKRVLREKGVPS